MGSQAQYYGGGIRITISADFRLVRNVGGHWSWHITASGGGLAVKLPDARHLIPGYPVIQVVNEGVTAFALEDYDGATIIASVAQNDVITLALFNSSTAAGDWEYGTWVQGAAAGPAATIYPWTLGGTDTGLITNAWRYDFIGDAWSEPGGASSGSHSNSSGFEVNGEGFIHSTTVFEKFDPSAWTTKTARAAQGEHASGAKHVSDDVGYLLGATLTADGKDTDSYDVSDDSWTSLTDMGEQRRKHFAKRGPTSANSIVYGCGNTTFLSSHPANTDTREYAITGDSHSNKTSCLISRMSFGASIDADNDVWCYGGSPHSTSQPTDDVEQYDVGADSWSTETDSPQGDHGGGGATRIDANGNNYTVGGTGPTSNDDATYEHNPQNDTYTSKTDHGAATGNARGISQGTTASLTD